MIALARLLGLLALLAFAAAAFDPVAVTFEEEAGVVRAAELRGADAATAALRAGALAGPRARDLVLTATASAHELPAGPIGAQSVLTVAPLPFAPEAIELRTLRRSAVGRPVLLSLACMAAVEPLTARVEIRDATGVVAAETVQLRDQQPIELAFVPDRAGTVAVVVAVEVAGQRIVATGELEIGEPSKVLVLEPSGVAAAALRAQGVVVERAGAMTRDLGEYAAVVVGAPLIQSLQELLVTAIDDGLGAFVLAPAFGSPGQPLHAVLPVLPEPVLDGAGGGAGSAPSDQPPAPRPPSPPPADDNKPPSGDIRDASPVSNEPVEVDKRTIAMVLVIDRSGSMGTLAAGGRTKMSYAKTSALQSAQALAAGDQVGLVTFGNKGAGRVELELTDVGQAERIRAGVERLAHGPEYTCLLSGLQHAERLLRGAEVAVRHVVVVTDGEFNTGETVALRALAHRMFREEKISVTILSIIDSQTPPGFKRDAEFITRDGGGQFFAIPAAESVPVFVSAEVTRSLERVGRRPGNADDPARDPTPPEPEPDKPEPKPPEPEDPVDEQPEAPSRVPVRAVATSPVLEPLPAEWPTLTAAVPTTAPLDAQVLLVAGDSGWPLLAYGNRGVGRIGAFAADLCGPAGEEMRREESFSARLALWVQHVMRAEPVGAPQLVPMQARVEPGALTPSEVAALARFGGSAPSMVAADADAVVRRAVESQLPIWAFAALAVLVLLVLAERLAILRGRV